MKRLQAGQRAYPRRRPFTGAWIETFHRRRHGRPIEVAPSRGRGLKQTWVLVPWRFFPVAPSRGRGLKPMKTNPRSHGNCRPFTGAWIETRVSSSIRYATAVAPSRGRGLKHLPGPPLPSAATVAPSRGRGLKRFLRRCWPKRNGSPLHGGVD